MRGIPQLEALEERALLSVTSVLNGTVLSLTGNPGTAHNVLVRPTANTPGSFDIVADGATTSFTGLTQVNYQGGNQGDTFTNRVAALPGTINVGNGANVVYTIAPGSTVTSGNGRDVLQVTGGKSTITDGNGNDSVYGGPGDTITVGNGRDVIYDILPGNTSISVAQHSAIDHLFVGPQTVLTGALSQDHVAQFFVTAPLGSGTLAVAGNTLYYAATNAGDLFFANQFGNTIYVTYGPSSNVQTATFAAGSFNQIAAFGGTGNDIFVNNTNIDDVMYGAGGSNFLEGGFGSLDLEKAGGQAATGSVAIGRSPDRNDLNGSGITNTTNVLIFDAPASARNIARSNSPTDVIFGLKPSDVLVTLYPDQVIAGLLPPFVPA